MKTKLFLLSLLLFVILPVYSQMIVNSGGSSSKFAKFAELEILAESKLECIYAYTVKDLERKSSQTEYMILQAGNTLSKFWGLSNYRRDSVIYQMDITKISTNEAGRIYGKYGSVSLLKDKFFIDGISGKVTVLGRIFLDNYVYEEDIPAIAWDITNQRDTICGYACQQATATFAGRNWAAWFANIPVNAGPWKLCGLPGLILKAEDEEKEHCFEAITIRNSTQSIHKEKKHYIKTTRDKYIKGLNKHMEDPGTAYRGTMYAPKDENGKEIEVKSYKPFYNQIEKL
ncbi:GLPGLI family protein [Bacteroides sp. 214]|uniref:GLPGLI family protein n=1 Tax=Bacteroides sp. 214 TaxID=2302935 RepID=UPI0013D37BFA|nr:GLPGLI family protein [Bacteroides sp. 214]NDW12244.1 GLPGLI family protein [Bacteroides sp. 214]